MKTETNEPKIDWCPRQGGTYKAYFPQFQGPGSDKWHAMDVQRMTGGIPFPQDTGGVSSTIGLLGRAQALAIMWAFKAVADAEDKFVRTRLQVYEVVYDIKARVLRTEEAEEGRDE